MLPIAAAASALLAQGADGPTSSNAGLPVIAVLVVVVIVGGVVYAVVRKR